MDEIEKLKRMAASNDVRFWRSLEDACNDPRVREDLRREFPQSGELWDATMTRRSFLKLMGAQILMLSLAGCIEQAEKIIPYVKSPEELIPGKPLFFASALSHAGFARGVLVESHMGRPTKIEGNPEHPDSLGGTDPVTQAVIYQLYDPDRSRSVLNGGVSSTWLFFTNELKERIKELKQSGGRGLRFLSRPIISPSLASLRGQILADFPEARWHQYSPLDSDITARAYATMYGENLQPVYNIKDADVILSIGSDFISQGAGSVAYCRAFASRRQPDGDIPMNRLYAIESTPTLTGAMADHRLAAHPAKITAFVDELLAIIERHDRRAVLSADDRSRIGVIADDLLSHRSRSLIIAGEHETLEVQMAACYLNHLLGNVNRTVNYIRPIREISETQTLARLTADLHNGNVSDLIVFDLNPVYASAGNLDFLSAYQKAKFRVHAGLYPDATARLSHWHIPLAHELESWGDLRAFNGTVTIRQPLIEPLYNGKTLHDIAAVFIDQESQSTRDMIYGYWENRAQSFDFQTVWQKTLHDGIMAESASGFVTPSIKRFTSNMNQTPREDEFVLLLRPDPHILDGQFVNNAWLQELPQPLTKLTWENAAWIAPQMGDRLGLHNGDVIELSHDGRSMEAPVWMVPGQADNAITVHLGYGQEEPGSIGHHLGFNAYAIQNFKSPYQINGVSLKKTGRSLMLASAQDHGRMEGRKPVRTATLEAIRHNPHLILDDNRRPDSDETLYRPSEHLQGIYQWGMSIDLNRCIGCSACTMACQVENNIPVVGKDQVLKSREMHWIRVDRYYAGTPENPDIHHQPVPCMHCENAPCEPVCPVEATTHSDEGLNEMTYNRCIGTRYCSNNCPYKVRRFNFYAFTKSEPELLRLGRNPDVTVRERGVMEKCTYCVQRINQARIAAVNENRPITDGEIVPACQQACPAEAIVFGNILDPDSQVTAQRSSLLHYGLLEELGTRPRTTYLAKIKNKNPDWSSQ